MPFAVISADCRIRSYVIARTIAVGPTVFGASSIRALVPRPSRANLLGFDRQFVQDARCSPFSGLTQSTLSCTEPMGRLVQWPAPPADWKHSLLREVIEGRQCEVLTEAGTAP